MKAEEPFPNQLWQEMLETLQNDAFFSRAIDYGNEYLQGAYTQRVAPSKEARTALLAFCEPLPEKMGDPFEILDMLHEIGSPGTMSQIGGRFFGLVNGGVVPVGLAARLLADTWDQNAALHAISPTNAVLEETCQDWVRELLGLPTSTVAGFVSGTSMAIVCGLAAARWRLCERLGYDINAVGVKTECYLPQKCHAVLVPSTSGQR